MNTNVEYISYTDAVRDTLSYAMSNNKDVFVMGQGVNDQIGMFGMTNNLEELYGSDRCFDTPLSEAGMAGIAVGAAMAGKHPVYFHNRPDFMILCFDQLINHASKIHYMSGGQFSVPFIMWGVTGQGWGSAAQHSQTIQGMLMHVPGIKIAMPTTPYDVKGLLNSALDDNNPVVFLDHRKVHGQNQEVPKEYYKIPFGEGVIRKSGNDVTVVAVSTMVEESLKAADKLKEQGISVEVIDLRTIKPYDKKIICESVRKTKNLVVVDTGWKCCGFATEVASSIYEEMFDVLERPVQIVALPDVPTPAAYNLEDDFYVSSDDVYEKIKNMFM